MAGNKVVLLDGNSLAYRAFFALPLLTNEQGIHTNAVYGFTLMLQKILEDENPTHLLVAFDAGKTTFRHATYAEYKGGRQKTPPELSEQFPYIRKLLKAYNILEYELPNYEADDIIGTISRQANERGDEVIIVSGDKDLTQLASPLTKVYITRKGITDLEIFTVEHVLEKYGLQPVQIIDMKGLMGDASDNIPGVPGVGEKTALKLLLQYGSVESVLENIDNISGAKLKENLTVNKDKAILSKELATIECNAPVEITIDELKYARADETSIFAIWKELSFKSLMEKSSFVEEVKPMDKLSFTVVEKADEIVLEDEMSLHVEMYDEHYHTAQIVGIALAGKNGTYFITPEIVQNDSAIKNWLQCSEKQKRTVDSKATIAAMHRLGIDVKGISFDFILAAYIANPSLNSDDVAGIANEFGYSDVLKDEQIYGKGAKKALPDIASLAEHICRKVVMVSELYDKVLQTLEQNDQSELYYNLELPLAIILGEMETTGIHVDRQTLTQLGDELTKNIAELEKTIEEIAGESINLNSPKQLGVLLFEKLGLQALKKTKTGYSTAADVLEKLEGSHPIITPILHYRQLVKLNSTYIEGLLKEIGPDNKIHTRYQQALTQTGRLSSIQPNLQNIPIRLEEGRKIRQAFTPSQDGWVLFAADYSQIELRVLAHMSEDSSLIEAFRSNMDIHTKTAMDVFHVGENEVTSEMRRAAKAVNFGIVYGISDYGLSQNLSITRKEAQQFIDRYMQTFPGVKTYMHDIVQDAKMHGFVQTIMNRRRYLPDITSSNFNIKSFAERTAMNTPIQGSAADIIKKAMIDMDARLKKENLQARMLLQVHDELILEAPESELQILQKLVPEVMEQAVKLLVPLKVDAAYGKTWYETK